MPNIIKDEFLEELKKRYGTFCKLNHSQSLYELGNQKIRIYIRYSKIHNGNRTFYGLRSEDLKQLEGYSSLICFLWDGQIEPLFIQYSEYEEVFQSLQPANDGQYKTQIYLSKDGIELYVARAGRFNVEGQFGWDTFESLIKSDDSGIVPIFTHSQVQTLLGAIGANKNFNVWIPASDRSKLDFSITSSFECNTFLPYGFETIKNVLQEVDVIWIKKGSNDIKALFEVEHSTPIYSALLRFNDIHLVAPNIQQGFNVVSNDTRRSLFVRQLNRPTFQTSGLSNLCSFLEYTDVFNWHKRVRPLKEVVNVE